MKCVYLMVVLTLALVPSCEMKSKVKDYPTDKQLILQRKETTPVDFTRLLVMRLVYGVAKMMGYEEPLSEVLNGALVPPGADDDDDDFDFFGGDDDDDY